MTNREKYITKRDEYDLLMEISDNIQGTGTYCTIRAVSGTKRPCLTQYTDEGHIYRDCENCIQKFLNEQYSEG